MKRGRQVFLFSAFLFIAVLGGAALVFREGILERWLLWRLEHGDPEQARKATKSRACSIPTATSAISRPSSPTCPAMHSTRIRSIAFAVWIPQPCRVWMAVRASARAWPASASSSVSA